MTTLLPAAPRRWTELPRTPLGNSLRALHARRLGELRAVLEGTQGPEAGVWSRWSAARLVNHLLSAWFEPERGLIEEPSDRVQFGPTTRLWVAAELVQSLRWQVDHAIGLCHHPDEFSSLTLKIETVLEHWCREVEDAFSRLRWQDLSDVQYQGLRALLREESHVT